MRRGAFLLVMLTVSIAAFAAAAPYGGQLVVAYLDPPESLNPLTATFGSAVTISWAFTNGLVGLGPEGQDVPDLAQSWDVSPDGLTWAFNLRGGVKFSDGTDFTSDDVLATFKPLIDPSSQSGGGLLPQLVRFTRADGKQKVVFTLKSPYSLFADLVQQPIVPARAVTGTEEQKAQYEKMPVGTGPFMLQQWTKDQIVLDANPNYYGGKPHLDRIVFKRFEDQKQAWASLMQGKTDIVYDVDNEDYLVIKDDQRFKTYESLDGMCFPLLFNMKDQLMSQPGIRQAITLAIDRKDLIDKALLGGGVPTTGPFMPSSWAYNPDPSIQPFDPAKSIKILNDLGWKDTNGDWIVDRDGKNLQFAVLIDEGDPLKLATAKRLQWQLLQVGMQMQVEVLPIAQLVQEHLIPGKFQAAIAQENSYGNPDTIVSTFWQSAAIGSFNLGSYDSPVVDRLITLARATTNSTKKTVIYRQIHKTIANDYAAAFLYFKKRFTATSSRVGGFIDSISGQYSPFMASWFVIK